MDAKYFDNVFQNYADDRNFIENKNSEECSVVPAGVFGLTVMEHLQGVITKKLRELELPFFCAWHDFWTCPIYLQNVIYLF